MGSSSRTSQGVEGVTQSDRPGVIAATIDEPARFHLDALRWFLTATELAEVAPEHLLVAVVGRAETEVTRRLRDAGVEVVMVERFDSESPHCNKIAGALAVAERQPSGPVVLTDLDLAFLADPRSLASPGMIAGKTVDATVPKLAVLDAVISEAGFATPPEVLTSFAPVGPTRAGNFNGGLYVLDGSDFAEFAHTWARWARWLLDRRALLDRWAIHVDQVSNLLAQIELGLEPLLLDDAWNQATHKPDQTALATSEPKVLHYHTALDSIGRLAVSNDPLIDDAIGRVNAVIDDEWQGAFPNQTFWTWRYQTNPTLGSGVGSRGDALVAKQELFSWLEATLVPATVLDIGCGDGEVSAEHWIDTRYTGVDLSPAALAASDARRDGGQFLLGSATEMVEAGQTAELVMCLDVLIHQPTKHDYLELVRNLLRVAPRALLVSGYERDPNVASPMVHFHEPLSETIARMAPRAECYPMLDINGSVAHLVVKPPPASHPRDFASETLRRVVARHPHPQRLFELRQHARSSVRFYPDHEPRLWEYPWVADQLAQLNPGRVADIGAGVNPLVPYLTEQGWQVHTVDPSTNVRSWPVADDANEWGYLDYEAAGIAAASHNTTLAKVLADTPELRGGFDAVFSVSVVEHVPAADRRALFADLATAVTPGGWAFLTVDVTKDTNELWNRVGGRAVDTDATHGSFDDLLAELAAVGFTVEASDVVRNWGVSNPEVVVDIGWVTARRD